MTPETHYTQLDGLRIAYQILGDGPPDVVFTSGSFNHIDVQWEDAGIAVFFRRMASFCRLIRFDMLGAGASDRVPTGASRPGFVAQLGAVLEAAKVERFVLIAGLDAAPGGIEYAVTHRDRVTRLILYNTTARFTRDLDYDIGVDREVWSSMLPLFEEGWGTPALAALNVPSRSGDERFVAWYSKYLRSIGTPTDASRNYAEVTAQDVRHLLGEVAVPTLVLHRSGYAIVPPSHGEYLAEHIAGAEYVELPGTDGPLFWDAPDVFLREVERFIGGLASPARSDRVVLSILFTDIVRSTERAEELGDRDWGAVLSQHDEISRKGVEQFGGWVVEKTGDGVLAAFPTPSGAIRAAVAIRDELRRMSVDIRSGIHVGEVEPQGDEVHGLAVHLAARVMAQAGAGQILVSRTVRDLVAGSTLEFADAGTHEFKGISEPWDLYRVEGDRP